LTSPLNTDINVARNKVITVNFSKEMDASSINNTTFTVKQSGIIPIVAGTISYSGTTAQFTPSTVLAANTLFIVSLTTGVKSLDGIGLNATKEWSFTTTASVAGLAPIGLGSAGNYAILAKTAITNVPTSLITGNLGLSPAATSFITGLSLTDFTGYATSAQVTGK